MTTISIRIADASTQSYRHTVKALPWSLWVRLMSWLRSAWCVINGGHYKVLHTEPDKLALRCVACGHMSPGWQVGASRAAHRAPANSEEVRVRRPVAA
jgi:hypothetical protein